MPEMPEIQAHAERLTADFAGSRLQRFVPLTFTALKTAVPAPDVAYGSALEEVGRRGKYLLAALRAGDVRRPPDAGRPPARRHQAGGQATRRPGPLRVRRDGPGAAAHRAGHRAPGRHLVRRAAAELTSPPLDKLGPEAATIEPDELAALLRRHEHAGPRVPARPALRGRHRPAPGQRGLHRAKVSPFAMTGKLGADGAAAIVDGHPRGGRGRPRRTSAPATT